MDKSEDAEKTEGEEASTLRPLKGRALVRDRLLGALAGLPRRKGATLAQHDKDMDLLVEKLAYLSPQALDGLAEIVLRESKGKHWPEVALVRAWAYALEAPPPRASDYAQSVIRSAMGKRAWDGGYAVELLRHARAVGPPPQSYLVHVLTEKADDNRRRREGIRAEQEAGRARPEALRWLDAWHDDYALCRALVGADEAEAQEQADGRENAA